MNSHAFRAAIRSTAQLRCQRRVITPSTATPRQALFSLRQTARSYASTPAHGTGHTGAAHHTDSDAAWVIGSLLVFGPLIYKLTAPPPRKKADVDHTHHSGSKQSKHNEGEDEAEEKEQHDDGSSSAASHKREKDFYPYILIGAGTASFAAMEAIREKDPSATILIIGNEDIGPYMRPPLSKEMWFNKSEETTDKLSFKDWQGNERNIVLQGKEKIELLSQEALDTIESVDSGVKVLTGAIVSDLNVAEQTITLNSGKTLKYGKVLLATGGVPKTLPVLKGAGEDKVTTFRSVQDFKKLHALIKSTDKKIVIIGGGFLGSELAVAVSHYGKEKNVSVTQIFPEDGNMGLVFPRYLSKWTTSQVEQEGVVVKSNSRVASTKAVGDQVELTLESGEKIVADHVVVAVGIEANVELAKKAGLELDETRGGVVVNAELQARHNVYCAGDMTSFHDVTLGRRRVEHYDNAILGGRVAGQNMASDNLHKPYKHQSMFWSDLGPHIGYEAVGILDSKLSTVSIWTKKPTVVAGTEDAEESKSEAVAASSSASSSEKEGKRERATATPLPAEGVKVEDKEKYNKGLVLYLKDKRIVGLLMWNNFGKVEDARKILGQVYDTEKVETLVKPFGIHEE
ncbi:apoptosis-inducing factor, mitochondrion-associated, C-term-domain-containing protein [Dissophora ornata]|nr:Apoptosis-inducing factor 1, mitochondrial [Dissophora ornata]KAI8605835.1 apoptosis-inducing factor, mitochondrion-associated, C-term-domain-containing protein [Dissophora ornata]